MARRFPPLGPLTVGLIALLSCRSIVENDEPRAVRSPSAPVEQVLPADDGSGEQAPTVSSKPESPPVPMDPLAEVARLWYDGFPERARTRFWQDDVRALADGERGSEWSIWRGRLHTLRKSGSQLGLAGDNVSALALDGDDLWIGTWTGGLVRYSIPLDRAEVWDPGQASLAVRTVNRILPTEKAVYVVRYGAVEVFDKRTSRWTSLTGLPVNQRIQDLHVDGRRLYLGTLGQGLWMREGGRWSRIIEPGLFIARLEPSPGNALLVATMDRGPYRLDIESGGWTRPAETSLRSANVTSLVATDRGLLGGTYGSGAFLWDPTDDRTTELDAALVGDGYVLAVARSRRRLYLGTFGAGLRSWVPDQDAWGGVSLAEGLPSSDVASIAVGDGTVWIGVLGGGIIGIDEGIYGD